MSRIENFVLLFILIIVVAIICVKKKLFSDAQIVATSMAGMVCIYYFTIKGKYYDFGTVIILLALGAFLCVTAGQFIGQLVDEMIKPKGERNVLYWCKLVVYNIIACIIVVILLMLSL